MLCFTEFVPDNEPVAQSDFFSVTLPYHQRQKSRLRITLDNGDDAALQLERGYVLQHGQLLRAQSGELVKVCAATEAVSTAYTDDPLLLAKTAYHLGNRHVALQVGEGWLRYLQDHVLDEMVSQLGLNVKSEQAAFEPESGAYASGHSHHHE